MTLTTLPEKPSRTSASRPRRAALARYADAEGYLREVLALPGYGGSVLVVDRDATTYGDRRLVAHLAADEPAENANVVCRHYLQDPRGRRCRLLTPEDVLSVPFSNGCEQDEAEGVDPARAPETVELVDRNGCRHRLQPLAAGLLIPELRWCRRLGETELGESGSHSATSRHSVRRTGSEPVVGCVQPEVLGRPESVRDAIACMESYEPVRTLTARALARHREDPGISVAVLRAELRRIDASRIVLNRELRRAVLDAMRTRGLSLSEIAFRCGRVKHDGNGNTSGETSWLSRRVGISPESGGDGEPTPWIHSEVLAVIAREGLGISPHEVEL